MESTAQDVSLILPIFLFMCMGIVGFSLLAFWIWMLVDCIKHESDEGNNKLIWVLVIIFTQLLGAIIYFFVQRRERLARSKLEQPLATEHGPSEP